MGNRISGLSGLDTDIRLPGEADGWEIARYARKLRADIPVVYTTVGCRIAEQSNW